MYLASFTLPNARTEELIMGRKAAENGGAFPYLDNPYPCFLFPSRGLSTLTFAPLTVLYGGNGSGKSTLLNIMAEKLGLERTAPSNSGEMFPLYLENTAYELAADDCGEPCDIPAGSRIITSDDIFDYMLGARDINNEIAAGRESLREEYRTHRDGRHNVHFTGLDDYERLHEQNEARRLSRHQYEQTVLGRQAALGSNGETAIAFFKKKLEDDRLYLLDEPENSMSPAMQKELCTLIEQSVRYLGDQFVIATHSPFLLALPGARIYNLDADPVTTCNWWELPNVRAYYDFFRENENLFR